MSSLCVKHYDFITFSSKKKYIKLTLIENQKLLQDVRQTRYLVTCISKDTHRCEKKGISLYDFAKKKDYFLEIVTFFANDKLFFSRKKVYHFNLCRAQRLSLESAILHLFYSFKHS